MATPAAERYGERRAECCGLQRPELRKDSKGFGGGVTHIAHFSNLLGKKALQKISCARSQCVPKSMKTHPRENLYHEGSTGISPYPHQHQWHVRSPPQRCSGTPGGHKRSRSGDATAVDVLDMLWCQPSARLHPTSGHLFPKRSCSHHSAGIVIDGPAALVLH